jgi:AraC-like DNA-binding protein
MKYCEIKSDGFLANFIKCFWEFQNSKTEIEYTILPDGYFDLIIELVNGSLKNIIVTGVWTKPVNVKIPKDTKLFAVRFKLLAAEYLFKQEIKSILNTAAVLPLNFWQINTINFSNFEKTASIFSNNLNLSLKHLNEIDSRKINLFELIYKNNNCNVAELSEKVFWSSRQINRYFTKQFGFPIKTFLNIIRCNTSFANIAKGEFFPTKEFFDQSHFIKQVKKYTGATPKELSKNKNDRFLQLATIRKK